MANRSYYRDDHDEDGWVRPYNPNRDISEWDIRPHAQRGVQNYGFDRRLELSTDPYYNRPYYISSNGTDRRQSYPRDSRQVPISKSRQNRCICMVLAMLCIIALLLLCALVIFLVLYSLEIQQPGTVTSTPTVPPSVITQSPVSGYAEVNGAVTMMQTFLPQYNDKLSAEYMALEKDFITSMDNIFMSSTLRNGYEKTVVTGFSPGSVRVIFIIVFSENVVVLLPPQGVGQTISSVIQDEVNNIMVLSINNGACCLDLGIDSTTVVIINVQVGSTITTTTTTTDAVTTVPNAVTTVPNAVTTVPNAVTTVPNAVSTIPNAVTTVPNAVITVPNAVTTVPNAVTTVPNAVTTVPNAVTTVPNAVTTVPNAITTVPDAVTTVPNAVTTVPDAVTTTTDAVTTTTDAVTTTTDAVTTTTDAVTTTTDAVTTTTDTVTTTTNTVNTTSVTPEFPPTTDNSCVYGESNATDIPHSPEQALPGDWPWVGSLQLTTGLACGVTLISDQLVVTSASCVSGIASIVSVVLGTVKNSHDPLVGGLEVAIAHVHIHPGYDPSSYVNNIAFLQLAHPIQPTANIQPVCIDGDGYQEGDTCVIAGWGTVSGALGDNLKNSAVLSLSSGVCDGINQLDLPGMYLCGEFSDPSYSLIGDAGGGLMCNRTGKWTLVGIVDFQESGLILFTNVLFYMDAITSLISYGDFDIPCQAIEAPICQAVLPYATTFPPMNQTNIQDYIQQYQGPLLSCHTNATAFLCGIFLPYCDASKRAQTICRDTCKDVVSTCASLFVTSFNLEIDCNQYPDGTANTAGLCNSDGLSCGNDNLTLFDQFDKLNFSSPNYPLPYFGADICLWIIKAPPGSYIVLRFLKLDTESCCDVLTIGEGNDSENRTSILQHVSGNFPPLPIVITASMAWIRFQSDGSVEFNGFVVEVIATGNSGLGSFCSEANTFMCSDGVSCIPFEWRCDGVYDCLLRDDEACREMYQEFSLGLDGFQHLISPGYHTTGYQSNTFHTYVITTVPGNKLIINFDGFGSERDYDFLYVGDGIDPQNETSLFFRWSGESLPPPLLSESNQMWIKFESDGLINYLGYDLYVYDVAGSVTFECQETQHDCGHLVCIEQLALICDSIQDCVDGSDEQCVEITASGGITLLSPYSSDSFLNAMDAAVGGNIGSGYRYRGTVVDSILPIEMTSENATTKATSNATTNSTYLTAVNFTIFLTDLSRSFPSNVTRQILLDILQREVVDNVLGDLAVLEGSLQLYEVSDDIPPTFGPTSPPLCSADKYECKLPTCIDLDSVCDQSLDCPDGSDEDVGEHCPVACGTSNITLTPESGLISLSVPSSLPDMFHNSKTCHYTVTAPANYQIYMSVNILNVIHSKSHFLTLDFGQDVSVFMNTLAEEPKEFLSLTNTIEITWFGYYWTDDIQASIEVSLSSSSGVMNTCNDRVQVFNASKMCDGVYDCADFTDEINCNAECGQSNYILEYNQEVILNLTNYPEPYSYNSFCLWQVTGPAESILVFQSVVADISPGDILAFVQGHDVYSPASLTFATIPGLLMNTSSILVDGNQGSVVFYSDFENSATGFRIGMTALMAQDVVRCENGIQAVAIAKRCDGVVDCEGSPTDETDCDQCISIPSLNCSSILPYSTTFFPNAFAANAIDAMGQYERAQENFCAVDTQEVICALLFPACPVAGSPTQTVCRSDCEASAQSCPFREGICDTLPETGRDGIFCTYIGDVLETGICGTVSLASNIAPRIVNGEDADEGEWPWTVVVLDSDYSLQCGGSLISSQWAVTAAHCAHVIDSILAGVRNLANVGTNYELVKVSEVIVHELYGVNFDDTHDIALMKLERPVAFTDYIRPICLNADQNETEVYTRCYATGWGRIEEGGPTSDILQEVRLPLIDLEDCRKKYEGDFVVNEFMVCAGFEEGGKDSCQGDSGGPFVCETGDGQWTLVGATSFGLGCARPGKPGVYTRISQYIDFIDYHVNKDPPTSVPII